jgi:FkbM family methyltransferase
MAIDRLPTMTDAVATLTGSGVHFGSIIDVGVQYETPALKHAFPHLKHHLFEPVRSYFEEMERRYKEIPHVLHDVALSGQSGVAFLNSYATHGDGQISHSYLSDKPATPDDKLVSCTEITMTTLDHEMASDHGEPYLLKIDVDGHEPQVLSGARETLRRTAVVVIEASLSRLPSLTAFLTESGFRLFDVVDLSYYRGTLWQVDLILVRDDLMRENPRLDPAGVFTSPYPFDVTYWHTHNPNALRDELAAARTKVATAHRRAPPLQTAAAWLKAIRKAVVP